MSKDEYIRRFDLAASDCRQFAQRCVIETLPEPIRFDIPFGTTGNEIDNIKFLGGRLMSAQHLRNMSYTEARKSLWVDGKVPYWINMQVSRIEDDTTIIEIHLSHKLTKDDSRLYHIPEGNPPFHILGPSLPHHGYSVQKDGKFSLTKSR